MAVRAFKEGFLPPLKYRVLNSNETSNSVDISRLIQNPGQHFHKMQPKFLNQPKICSQNQISPLRVFQYEHVLNSTFVNKYPLKPHKTMLLEASKLYFELPNTTKALYESIITTRPRQTFLTKHHPYLFIHLKTTRTWFFEIA